MALTNGFVTTAGTAALDARQMETARIIRNPDNSVRTGQLYGDSNAVKATSSMAVTVLGDTSWVLSRGKTDGAVILANVGDLQLTLAAAPSANSRYDVVYMKQNDTEKGDANSLPAVDKVTGTAAASPTVPAAPSGALVLATVLVPAGVASTNASGVVINNTVQQTALNGSPIRYRTVAAMNSDAANVIDGYQAYVKGAGVFFLRGNQWVRLDADTFVVISQQQGSTFSQASSTTTGTLGGTSPSYSTSDATVFPIRQDGVIGPLTVSGWYEVTGQVNWSTNSSGERFIELTKTDDSLTPRASDRRGASGPSDQSVTTYMSCAAGDYIKLKGWQNSGSSLFYVSRLTARLLRMN